MYIEPIFLPEPEEGEMVDPVGKPVLFGGHIVLSKYKLRKMGLQKKHETAFQECKKTFEQTMLCIQAVVT